MEKKEAVKRVIICLLAAVLLVFATFSWFIQNKVADVSPVAIYSAESSKITAQLWHKTGQNETTEIYEKISRLECARFLPGQSEKYKIVLTSEDPSDCLVRIDFLHFYADVEGDMQLCEELKLQAVSADASLGEGEYLAPDGTFLEQYTQESNPENTSFSLANSIQVRSNGERTLFFEIALPGITDNRYQDMGVAIESIAIQVTPKL